MFPDGTGYIYLNRFARTTEEEIESAVTALRAQGMERLILDLRWNAGGYLDQAVKLASMFISGHKKIVYTRGRLDEFNEEYYSDTFRVKSLDIPLIVMVNHASASASEIVAGAIQDYDRGLIVGETSFGKGLVQREISLKGDARLRLTISKYYTPSGRLIQRPYKNKNVEDYYRAGFDSVAAETESDSAEARPEYATAGGRTVYGGGGITPDTVVAYRSESKVPRLTQQLFNKRVFFEVASLYASEHPEKKDNFDAFLNYFEVGADLLARLKAQADKSDIEIENRDFELDSSYMKTQLKAEIARSLWEPSRFYQVLMYNDNQVNTARQLFDIATGLLSSTQER
jgi:carboxyl-terminal processing protease